MKLIGTEKRRQKHGRKGEEKMKGNKKPTRKRGKRQIWFKMLKHVS
jgi:hypothetical protein